MQFLVVYIREAHALDGRAPMTAPGDPIVEEPFEWEERRAVCQQCLENTAYGGMPTVIDEMDNEVNKAYAAAPDRLYLVGKDGSVVYRGGRGPFGFHPDELEAAIKKELASEASTP